MFELVDPFERGILDRLKVAPRATAADDFGFVEVVDGFRQSVGIAVADAADRRFDFSFGKAFGVFDVHILAAAVGMNKSRHPALVII